MPLQLLQLCTAMPLAAQPLFQCHCHSILTLFPSRHHQADVFCLWGTGAIACCCCCCCRWCCLVMLLLFLSPSLIPFPVAGTITIAIHCHHHPSLSPSTIVVTIAVDHCHHLHHRPSSSPSLTTVDHLNIRHRRLIVILLFLFVVACCLTCFCHCCHWPLIMHCCHCCHRWLLLLLLLLCSCVFSFPKVFTDEHTIPSVGVIQWVRVGYCILQKWIWFPPPLLWYSWVWLGTSKRFMTVQICRIKILQQILGLP